MSRHTEAAFEGVIKAHLLANGYTAVPSREYDPARAVFPAFVLGFIHESQLKAWARLESLHGAHGQAVRPADRGPGRGVRRAGPPEELRAAFLACVCDGRWMLCASPAARSPSCIGPAACRSPCEGPSCPTRTTPGQIVCA
jgi:hypothetical protein